MSKIDDAPFSFCVGDHVRKRKGYDWPGIVRGHAPKSCGKELYMVENRLCPLTVHIFTAEQLKDEDRTDAQIIAEVASRILT